MANDNVIRAGDLVVVVGTTCRCATDVGLILTVVSVGVVNLVCRRCGVRNHDVLSAEFPPHTPHTHHAWKSVAVLRKIRPLDALEEPERDARPLAETFLC